MRGVFKAGAAAQLVASFNSNEYFVGCILARDRIDRCRAVELSDTCFMTAIRSFRTDRLRLKIIQNVRHGNINSRNPL